MKAEIAIHLEGVTKSFGRGQTRVDVLRGIDLDAYFGEILLLVGPSGCGKTTLLSVLSGLLDTELGQIVAFGSHIEKMSDSEKTTFRRENVGFVFQQFNLIPTLSAAENAAVPLFIQGIGVSTAKKLAEELLEQVGLGHRSHAYPSELSGGEQQRVAIARSLISNPRLLICDEPTAALDGDTGYKVMEVLRESAVRPDRCVIVVTHDSRVLTFGDRIAHMLDGKIQSVEVPEHAAG